jgi:hypothetical protein
MILDVGSGRQIVPASNKPGPNTGVFNPN